MILHIDEHNKFTYQLTKPAKYIPMLDFATKHFEGSEGRDCCIKRDKDGMYSVYTTGEFIGKDYHWK